MWKEPSFLDRGSERGAPEPEDGENSFSFSIFILFFFSPSPQLTLRCTAIVAVALSWALKTLRQPSLRTQVLGKGVSRVQKVWDAYHLLLALFSLQVALGHPRCSEMCPVHGLKFSERHWFYSQRARKKDPWEPESLREIPRMRKFEKETPEVCIWTTTGFRFTPALGMRRTDPNKNRDGFED